MGILRDTYITINNKSELKQIANSLLIKNEIENKKIKIKPLDTYSYTIGLITILIWIISDKLYEKYFK